MEKLYEQSETGCCPRFNPEPWDEEEVIYDNKYESRESLNKLRG